MPTQSFNFLNTLVHDMCLVKPLKGNSHSLDEIHIAFQYYSPIRILSHSVFPQHIPFESQIVAKT
jgi:hypothetical protein